GLSMILALGLAISTIGGATTALAEESDEFVVTAIIASEPETLDPNMESSVDGATYSMHMFENLMKYTVTDENATEDNDSVKLLEVTYGQAESYEVSDDGLTYTFTLRDDIYWSDGEPVTAADFEYSWKRIVNPDNAADYGYILDGVVLNASAIQAGEAEPDTLGIEATDDKTLVITLEAECPYFLGLCAFAALMPIREDIIEEYGTEWTDPGNMVSNGAYVLSAWEHDSYIEMSQNEYYYDNESVGPDKIEWQLQDSESAILASYQADEIDFTTSVSTEQLESLVESGDCYLPDEIGTYYLYLNCDNISDWRVRAAITLVIDRDNIVENVTQGGQTSATGLVAAGTTNNDGTEWTEYVGDAMFSTLAELYPDYDLTTYSGRCELAVALLDEAVADGYDTSVTIDYEYNTSEAHEAIAEAVQADVADVLGLNITLNNSEWQTYTNNLGEGNFGMARLGWIADYDDASTYLELFTNGNSYNYSNWVSDEYTELVTEFKALSAGEERDELMKEAEYLLFGEGGFAVCPIYFYTDPYLLHEGIDNIGYTPLGYFIFTYAEQAE
ncbi:MAG: peptide ABC transporter substrate-binding protein, partial [Lachnospiraceae bacterium]|nr:peptide ABC transporter substrate-binding protein [Lachnospiraceae bacterium]